jgi:hypothetical protein
MATFHGEKLEQDLATKQIYYFHDPGKKLKQISKEVFKKKDQIIHYPRGFDGGPKYATIERFVYRGFKGNFTGLVGVFKVATFGYGFTKKLRPFAKFLDANCKIKEVIIEKGGKVVFDKTNQKLFLNENALRQLFTAFDTVFTKNKAEVESVLFNTLHSLFPATFKKPKVRYIANTLASSLSTWGSSLAEFSEQDKTAIKGLFDQLSLTKDFLSADWLSKTKELIDTKYLNNSLVEFQKLRARKVGGASLEKAWQGYLKQNSWIFSSIFAQPVILHQDEAYVGGKTIDNKNGKLNDFLIKNSLSDNVSFLEIKTHLTELLKSSPYRGNDVFSASEDLTGSVGQVLNQRDNFQKHYYVLKGTSASSLETLNSKCVVLIGSLKDLTTRQKNCFELFRSNSRDVEIITFDELQKKIESLQALLKK